MRTKAVICLLFSSKRQLKVVLEALKPETRATVSRRCRAQICGEGNSLTLVFEARDTSALRAAVNSYLRWMLLTKTVVESVDLIGSEVKG